MATKILQDVIIPRIEPAVGVASTSVAIALKSGYLRITIGSTTGAAGGYISIGNEPVATKNHFHIVSYGTDVIKETIKRQTLVGITTGTTTELFFDRNSGNPFANTDYVTVQGSSSSGINTEHKQIISVNERSIVVNYNTSSVVSPNVLGASVCRSVKVSCLTYDSDSYFNISEVVTLVSE